MTDFVIAGTIVLGLVSVVVVTAYLYYMRLWFRALSAGVPIPLVRLVRLSVRGVSPYRVVLPHIRAHEAGISLELNDLIARYEAGSDVRRAVNTMIQARRDGKNLSLDEAIGSG